MQINPNDYNRNERNQSTWWAQRHGRGTRLSENLRKSRRITMIDMILLAVMAGVLVPWFLTMDRGVKLGFYKVELSEKNRDGKIYFLLEMKLSEKKESRNKVAESGSPSGLSVAADGASSANSSLIGWKITDRKGEILHEDWDLPPNSGDSREFFWSGVYGETYFCHIYAEGYELIIESGKDT